MKTIIDAGEVKAKPPVTRNILLVFLATAFMLLIPLVAMRFTHEVVWSLGDFVVAGALLAGTGVTYVLAANKVSNRRYRTIIGVALGAALLLVWAELAAVIPGGDLDHAETMYHEARETAASIGDAAAMALAGTNSRSETIEGMAAVFAGSKNVEKASCKTVRRYTSHI